MNAHTEIAMLRSSLATAQETIQQLREAIQPKGIIFPPLWGLTGSEDRILRAIYNASPAVASYERLMLVLYSGDPGDDPSVEILKVFVSRIRKKLAPYRVGILNKHGHGYIMEPGSKQRLADALKAAGFLP